MGAVGESELALGGNDPATDHSERGRIERGAFRRWTLPIDPILWPELRLPAVIRAALAVINCAPHRLRGRRTACGLLDQWRDKTQASRLRPDCETVEAAVAKVARNAKARLDNAEGRQRLSSSR